MTTYDLILLTNKTLNNSEIITVNLLLFLNQTMSVYFKAYTMCFFVQIFVIKNNSIICNIVFN